MDKYEKLMREIIDSLDGTWLVKAAPPQTGKEPIRGCSPETIQRVAGEIGKKLPRVMQAWYLVAGEVPPYLGDQDADYSIQDLLRTQEIAADLTRQEGNQWQLAENMIPFLQRLHEQFLFVAVSEGDPEDPPVYRYLKGATHPTQASIAFSAYMRETWLGWLEFPAWSWENIQEVRLVKGKGEETRLKREQLRSALHQEAREVRNKLICQAYREDIRRGRITGPKEFQRRWVREFSQTETWKRFQAAGLRMPFGWIDVT